MIVYKTLYRKHGYWDLCKYIRIAYFTFIYAQKIVFGAGIIAFLSYKNCGLMRPKEAYLNLVTCMSIDPIDSLYKDHIPTFACSWKYLLNLYSVSLGTFRDRLQIPFNKF